MHYKLFTHTHDLSLPGLTACAESIGLEMNRFKGDMADRLHTQRIQEHRRVAVQSGVRTTPTYFLNGKVVDFSASLDRLDQAVHAALTDR
jgi:protein-disulfide isomerase